MKEIFTAATVEEAKAQAVESFGVSEDKIAFNVLEEPKKSLFGKLKGEAKVEAEFTPDTYVEGAGEVKEAEQAEVKTEAVEEVQAEGAVQAAEMSEQDKAKADAAVNYIKSILLQMGIEDAEVEASAAESGINIEISGTGFYEQIGKKGELLDALQYLSSLVCNKIDREYFRITTDCGGFRAKRKAQLERLAKKLANNVKKSGRSHALEPMNPYERRIIHAAVSEIEGVTSKSVGEDPFRKVIISSTEKRPYGGYKGKGGKRGGNGGRRGGGRPKPHYDITTSFEKNYKKPKPEDDMDLGSGVYGKIDF